jgi:hypothetical protein
VETDANSPCRSRVNRLPGGVGTVLLAVFFIVFVVARVLGASDTGAMPIAVGAELVGLAILVASKRPKWKRR